MKKRAAKRKTNVKVSSRVTAKARPKTPKAPILRPTRRWFSNHQDKNNRTAYIDGMKIQIDCTKCDQNKPGYSGLYFGTLTINGPNESCVTMLESKGTLSGLNIAIANRLKSVAAELLILADEIVPHPCVKSNDQSLIEKPSK